MDAKFKEESDAEKAKNNQDFGTKVTALVVRNNTAIDTYVKNKFGGYTKGRSAQSAKKDSCYMYGFNDGKNTQINKQVGGTSPEAKKLK